MWGLFAPLFLLLFFFVLGELCFFAPIYCVVERSGGGRGGGEVGGIIDVRALKKYQSFSSAAKQTNNPKKRGEKKDKVMPPSFYAITH